MKRTFAVGIALSILAACSGASPEALFGNVSADAGIDGSNTITATDGNDAGQAVIGSDSDGSLPAVPNPPNPPLDTWAGACTAMIDALQAGQSRCGITWHPDSVLAHIRERYVVFCQAHYRTKGRGETIGTLTSCASHLQKASCDNFPSDIDPFPVCDFSHGTLPTGSACGADGQCASGQCAYAAGKCGTCKALVPPNSPCQMQTDCNDDAYCSDSHVCTVQPPAGPLPGPGESCFFGASCSKGYYCNASNSSAGDAGPPPGACVPQVGLGSSCNPSLNNSCAESLACSTDTNTCVAVGVVGPGQTCTFSSECIGSCETADAGAYVCTMPNADGQPCDPTNALSTCDTFAVCSATEKRCVVDTDLTCP